MEVRTPRSILRGYWTHIAALDPCSSRALLIITRCAFLTQMTAAEIPNEASVASGVANDVPPSAADSVTKVLHGVEDETSRDEKNDGAGTDTEEKEDPLIDPPARADVVDRDTFPETFDELCRQTMERATFLLEVIPLPPSRLHVYGLISHARVRRCAPWCNAASEAFSLTITTRPSFPTLIRT